MIHPEFSRSVGLGEVLKSFVCSKVSSRFPGSWIANKFHVLYPPIPFISRTSFTSLLDFISLNSSLCTPSSLPNIQPSSITQKPNHTNFQNKTAVLQPSNFSTYQPYQNQRNPPSLTGLLLHIFESNDFLDLEDRSSRANGDLTCGFSIGFSFSGMESPIFGDFWDFLVGNDVFCFYKENGFSTFFFENGTLSTLLVDFRPLSCAAFFRKGTGKYWEYE